MQVIEEALGELVGAGRAARAPFVPVGMEHEVVQDQLPPTIEEIGKADGTSGAVKPVGLVDLNHGQVATFGADLVAEPGEFLLLRQQIHPGGQPLVSCHDLRKRHLCPLFLAAMGQRQKC